MKTISVLVGGLLLVSIGFADDTKVKITKNISSITVSHLGQKVEVKRIQDPYHILSDDYTKTSRECPPFCIHPMKVANGVKTIGEVEMMDYIKNYVNKDRGVIVDARLPSWYKVETIPSAINIPFTLLEEADKETVDTIFSSLGAKRNKNGWDFSNAKTLIVFDNGVWCDQATRFVKSILKAGYPAQKMAYYRDGFQGWKLLGLTTVIMEKKEVR
jgi:rhodanese-related sulfurtransferase